MLVQNPALLSHVPPVVGKTAHDGTRVQQVKVATIGVSKINPQQQQKHGDLHVYVLVKRKKSETDFDEEMT